MQTIFWAFGAMLLLLLIISFLPLDFNIKGKIAVVLAAFAIALGGLAAVELFPLWQTLLIMLVLASFGAYIMDSRLGNVLYKPLLLEEEMMEDIEIPFSNRKIEKNIELDLLDLDEVELASPSSIQVVPSLSPIETELVQGIETADSDDVDILFLQDRETENTKAEDNDELEISAGYLSEIESMLLEDSEEKMESVEEGWLDELADLCPIESEENETKEIKIEDNRFDEDELELLFADKEVAAGRNDQDPINSKKELEFQKK